MNQINLKTEDSSKVQEKATTNVASQDEDLQKEYVDEKSITISLVHNYSNYRKANLKVLGQKIEVIGSSVTSCRVLSSNKGEVEKYFPALIGLSSNNPEFITRVKAYLSNIRFVISNNDATLNTSFIYDHKSDYLDFKAKEEAIEDKFEKADKSNLELLKSALKHKIDALNVLESQKYKYGRPVNLEHYYLYRHCLLYSPVAKDMALINSDPTIRFYIKDDAKEAEKAKKLTEQRVKAMRNFVELGASEQKFTAVYVAMVAYKHGNIATALLKDKTDKQTELINFVNENPEKFNKFISDKNIVTKAFIEMLILRGELVRAEFNQQISSADGTFIGSNMNEAVAYFNNPNNKGVRDAYESKLKMF